MVRSVPNIKPAARLYMRFPVSGSLRRNPATLSNSSGARLAQGCLGRCERISYLAFRKSFGSRSAIPKCGNSFCSVKMPSLRFSKPATHHKVFVKAHCQSSPPALTPTQSTRTESVYGAPPRGLTSGSSRATRKG